MLEDKKMFNIPNDQIGRVTSELTIFSLPFSMVMTFFNSFIFEILGRRLTLFASFLLTSLVYFAIPYTAPDYNLLLLARCAIGITMAAPIAHPLIADYVKKNSRGSAVALAGVGLVLGEVFSMGVLFNLTKSMSYADAFTLASVIIALFSLFFLLTVKDPNLEAIRNRENARHSVLAIKKKRRVTSHHAGKFDPLSMKSDPKPDPQSHGPASVPKSHSSYVMIDPDLKFEKLPATEKVAELTTIVIQELNERPVLTLYIIGASITRIIAVLFSTYLILWIQSFCTAETLFSTESDSVHNNALKE